MASSSHSSDIRTLRREVEALQQRVSRLEGESHSQQQVSAPEHAMSKHEREWAEREAQMNTWIEYMNEMQLENYREHPKVLENLLESERQMIAFFRERGIEPSRE